MYAVFIQARLHVHWKKTGPLKGLPKSSCSVHRMPLRCLISAPTALVGTNLRSSWSLQCPQPVWLLCESVQLHVPPVNSKAFLGTLLARHTGPLCWADISMRGWHSEATHCASERFVSAHTMHQTHSHNTAVYSWIYRWQKRTINIYLLQAHIKHLNIRDPEFHLSLQTFSSDVSQHLILLSFSWFRNLHVLY